MHEVRLVFFDAGGTLVHPREDPGRVYAETARRYGLELEPAVVFRAFLDGFRAKKGDGLIQDRDWWRDVVRRTFAPFGEPTDPEAMFDELYEYFTSPSSWQLYPQARETVQALRGRGYRTGLISNWDDRLPELLEGLGLTPLLDPIVISYRVGAEKPDARIFETALVESGVPPERTLMVGDDYEADVVGARALGMEAVWIRRPRPEPPELCAQDGRTIDQLGELLEFLPGVDADVKGG